jgi:hypothetical protein
MMILLDAVRKSARGTNRRSLGSALCLLWEGAADIAGEGWTALDRRL